jgi:hypothetical protein
MDYPLIVFRYADDTIVVVDFQRCHEARAFLDDLKERMRKFELALHPDKTRLIRFGRHEFAVHGMGKKPPINLVDRVLSSFLPPALANGQARSRHIASVIAAQRHVLELGIDRKCARSQRRD